MTVAEGIGAPSRETLLSLYRQMLNIRRTEEALARLHQQGLVHGACHTYVGEEAIATGVCAHLRPDDTIFSTHRGHGHALAKGVTPHQLMAELLGRETGCAHGRGGSMHLFQPEIGLLGTSGIVGPSMLLAAGSAYAFKLNQTERVSVAFFGDGASNNGAFHEGINMATVWKLPVLFVCENNQYATEIAFKNVARVQDVSARAAGYGLPGVTVDGNDVLAVHEVAGEAVRRARAGEGPTLIECKTYRTRAHSEGCATPATEPRRRSTPGRSATRSGGCTGSSWRPRSRARATWPRSGPRSSGASPRRPSGPGRIPGPTPRPCWRTCTRRVEG